MSKLTHELQKQIEVESIKYESATQHEGLGPAIYVDGATIYAEKWQEAEQKAARYEKALKEIVLLRRPLNDDTAVLISLQALTPKQTTDDTAK